MDIQKCLDHTLHNLHVPVRVNGCRGNNSFHHIFPRPRQTLVVVFPVPDKLIEAKVGAARRKIILACVLLLDSADITLIIVAEIEIPLITPSQESGMLPEKHLHKCGGEQGITGYFQNLIICATEH